MIIVDTPEADNDYCTWRRKARAEARREFLIDRIPLGVVEIVIFLIIALIVIPPEHLPEVMRAVGKILRELRLASNTILREISGAIDEPPPYMRPPAYRSNAHPDSPPAAPASTSAADSPDTSASEAPAQEPPTQPRSVS